MMKEINLGQALALASPNPLTLVCCEKEDGTTNLAPISFVTCLSFAPPKMGFAVGRQAYTGKRVQETGRAVVVLPGKSLAQAVMQCGASSGKDTDKAAAFGIDMVPLPEGCIKIPADSRVVFVVTLEQTVEVGDHILYLCGIDRIYGNEERTALFAWDGFAKAAPAAEG